MPTLQDKIKKLYQIKDNPGLAIFQTLQELEEKLAQIEQDAKEIAAKQAESVISEAIQGLRDELSSLAEKVVQEQVFKGISQIKGEVGEKGEKGDSIKGEMGEIGFKGEKGEPGQTGRDGIDGRRGMAGPRGEKGLQGLAGVSGKDGKDGSPDEPTKIKQKLESLQGNDRLSARAIKDLSQFVGEAKKTLHRGGLKLVWTELLGTGDGTTTAFTLTAAPKASASLLMSVGGGLQFLTDDFTLSSKTITFVTAPPTGAKVRALLFHSQ